MNIKATFPPGVTEQTVHGLHQWDYGRKLEIQDNDLPAVVEVHFACAGMRDAVVRVCSIEAGVGTAVIPDKCLEQTSPIYAWIFVEDETSGMTVKTIILPIVARTQPQPSQAEPEDFTDQCNQLIAAVNAQVEALKAGNVMVSNAQRAESSHWADNALYAENAQNATFANKATTADKATNADRATMDAQGNSIPNTYVKRTGLSTYLSCSDYNYTPYARDADDSEGIAGGVIAFRIQRTVDGTADIRVITEVGGGSTCYSPIFYDTVTGGKDFGDWPMRLAFVHAGGGKYRIFIHYYTPDNGWTDAPYSIYPAELSYKHLTTYLLG